MLDIRKPTRRYIRSPKSVGGWLPPNKADVLQWVKKMADMSKANPPPRSGPVKALETLINNNAEVYTLFHEMMVEAVAGITACGKKPIDFPISDVAHLLDTLDVILTTGPAFFSAGDPQIGTPINALLVWPMPTKAGFAVFIRSDVNHAIKGILDYWGAFLKSPNSRSVLTNAAGGWFSADALADPHMRDFDKTYICDPTKPYWGFTSWDDFFTREFKPNLRPVFERVHLRDNFWLKGQPYSLYHMLDGDARASQFVNGSVYQAFLSADSYHRWHAPVSGRIVDYKIVPGSYSEPISFGFDPDDGTPAPDAGADENSQGYISAVAARGLLWIQADNPKIGLM
ncbi:phosphatidylserine decarboxylase family protein [Metarhizium brunneum]